IAAHFENYFAIPPARISTIPTGIDLKRFSSEGKKADLTAFGIETSIPLIGMISVLRSWKGHATFLEAARILRQRGFKGQFVIAGDGPGRDAIPAEIQARGLSGIVVLLGHREDIPELLRSLSVLCIPSTKHEGVPQIGL